MKTRPFVAASLLMAALNGAGAQGGGGSAAPAGTAQQTSLPGIPNIAFDKYTLPNGLQVILVEDKRLPLVAVNVWYHVGPANEVPGLTGFAHLFEHMMFAGSKHLPRGLADRLMEGAGASDSNGSTDYDRTNYYDTVPSNQLELALWVHADRMGYLLDVLDQKSLTNQQDVVRNERRDTVENEPYGIVEEALNHALFPQDHPYRASVIGSHTDIQNAKLDDVRDFFTRYYGPNNASIVIAGDIDKVKTRALVAKYFGSLRRGPAVVRPQVKTPPITVEKRLVVPDRVELPRVYMGWLTPPAYQPGDAELAVAAQILAGGKSSRLYKSLVYERQIAQDVDADQDARALTSAFLIEVTARAGHTPAELEKAIDAELEALREHGPTEQEVTRARNQIETAIVSSLEKLGGDGLADQLNHYNQYTGDPGYLAQDVAQLRRITPADVQRAVRTWLQPRARVVVAGVPGIPELPPDPPAPKPPKARAKAKGEPGGINEAEAWRAQMPKAGRAPRLKLPQGESFTLANGLTVIHHYNPALPLVSAELVVRSGSDANPPGLPGLAGFTAQMLMEGTATRSAPRIADEIAQLGAFMDADSSTGGSSVSLLSLRANFDAALAIMADVVQNPAFPSAEVERQRASRLGELMQQRDEPELIAALAAGGALFGPRHPYGYGQLGTEPAIRAVTRDDLSGFWRRHYVPGNAALVVAGDISRDELKALAEARFLGWKSAPVPPLLPGAPVTTKARVVLVDQPGAGQTALRLTSLAAERKTPLYPALEVMNAAFGGLFTSRINQNLREEKGYTYGVYSGFRYDRTPGPFIIAGSVRANVTGASVSELLKEAQAMIDRPLDPQELAGARNAELLSLPNRFETNADISASLAETFVFDLPLDYYSQLPAKLAAVTALDVQAAAKRYLDPARLTVVAVGERKKIAPQLDKLKLGPVEVRDSEGQLREGQLRP
ncbi:pitrilysin family protein [Massilia sp. Leaf139]|uniref:M16 family metallopeptidase n=1 Tax=Massilia sp. Leaf139 TaxID=1736272 RepID=UPI0006FCB676|nr:pitrilysin family protein [Massilia sp. Leaf139]KQQ87313.1 peptidase M16 [Massilia sp. Leaf139]